ncbi:glycoside hydrolase family 5 protein [Streptomyces sp. K1PN6]|uniref:cellulase n=2 Tax=Streptomyces acidicola TaxID=2596892 RepID=A0A5N8WUH5_9ACTN|nr:glycoside hydrolase family 5 protein [Streptomyces acidicola]
MNSPMENQAEPTTTATEKKRGLSRRMILGAAGAAVAVAAVGGTVSAFTMDSVKSGSSSSAEAGSQGPLRTSGANIVDSKGKTVTLTGVNWFGLETGTFAPHGLWTRNLDSMFQQMVDTGFNTLRLPYSNELFDAKSKPNGIDLKQNPDLKGLNGLQLMDKVVQSATKHGLMVILDQHRPDQWGQSELWYTDKLPESKWLSDWKMLAQRYKNNDLVIGADLHNEPRGQATWGDGNPKTDWKMAAEKAGNTIHSVNPNWLIFVEGNDKYKDETTWWGGELRHVKEHPVKLKEANKVVYSPHEYGPGVYNQNWFMDKDFPNNMPAFWDKHWGYLKKDNTAPLMLGEFGGRKSTGNSTEAVWQQSLMKYLKKNGISYTYWSWNPNSGDTGGVLKDDWKTLDPGKKALLGDYQAPLLKGKPENSSK